MLPIASKPQDQALQQAQTLVSDGRLVEAKAVCCQALNAAPDHPELVHLLGQLEFQTGRPQESVRLVQRAARLAPFAATFQNSLGVILGNIGRTQIALEAFRRALSLNPYYAEARENYAQLQSTASLPAAELPLVQLSNGASRDGLRDYQARVNQMRATPYMDYPAHVHIETLARCNAACTFCPYPELNRKGAQMPTELVEKIIDDLTELPRRLPFQLSPLKVNEPFLDPRLFDILRSCNQRLPNAGISLTSNGTPLTEKKIEELAQIENVISLCISMNDHRPQAYEATMKLPYERVLERLRMIHAKLENGQFNQSVILSRVGDGSTIDDQFRKWVGQQFPRFGAIVMQRGGWLGQVDTHIGQVPNVGCIRWFEISIAATGSVAHCCMDGQAQWPIGDVNEQHVLDIYNSPSYRNLRERTLTRNETAPCRGCTFL